MVNLKFISLSSGSSGNCYYFGNDEVSFIIDAGIGVRTIQKRLSEYNLSLESIDFILVTHDHCDHVKHLATLSKRTMKPVVATQKLLLSLEKDMHHREGVKNFKKAIEKGCSYNFKGVSITAFSLPHDATENLGYHIDFRGSRITIATDLGRVTPQLLEYCRASHHIVIESNYCHQMLQKSSYPLPLKERISGGYGHLSNRETAEALKQIYHPMLKNIFLCHLSDNNNTPEIAYYTSYSALKEIGVVPGEEVNLYCLPRKNHRCHIL